MLKLDPVLAEMINPNLEIRTWGINAKIHSHTFLEIMYVLNGSVNHTINGNNDIIEQGYFMFLDIGDVHEYQLMQENANVMNLLFMPSVIDKNSEYKDVNELISKYIYNTPFNNRKFPSGIPIYDDDKRIYEMLCTIKKVYEDAGNYTSTVLKHQLIALLLTVMQKGDKMATELPVKIDKITEYILNIVQNHYNEDNLLVKVHNELSYSLSYLSSVFKENMGISFKEYLQNYRIREAKNLLSSTDKKIYEICNEVGYSDKKYFINLFKKHTSMTPSEYRNSLKYL